MIEHVTRNTNLKFLKMIMLIVCLVKQLLSYMFRKRCLEKALDDMIGKNDIS